MPTYAIARQSLMRVAGLLTGRFDKDAHIVEREALEGTPAGLTVNNPRGPNTPAIALLFQNDLLDKYETLTVSRRLTLAAITTRSWSVHC